MSYRQGYVQGDYGAYQGYDHGQTNGYHVNQKQFVPNQQGGDVSRFPNGSLPSHPPQYQAAFYQQYPSQYEQASQQQQYYFPRSQQQYSQQQYSQAVQPPQQPVQPQRQLVPQVPVYRQPPQASYQQDYPQPAQPAYQRNPDVVDARTVYAGNQTSQRHHPSPHLQYQQMPRQPSHSSPQLLSSPDPLQTPQYQVNSQAFSTNSHSQPRPRQQDPRPLPQTQAKTHQRSSYSSAIHAAQSSPQQRVVAHVEIPRQRANPNTVQNEMDHPPKKRRSNEGYSVPVCDMPAPPQYSSQQPRSEVPAIKYSSQPLHPEVTVVSSPLTELPSSQLPPTPKPNIDYQTVLLALADEYIAAAYSMSASLSCSEADDERLEEYYRLISTAMGCLESVITNYRQSDARLDARLRLRLASLMVAETENYEEAHEILSKGIALCERSRLSDLKYAMHYLLLQVTFKSSPKPALKSTDKLIQEVETLRLVHWTYAFRLLRVSLSLEIGNQTDTGAVLKHLTATATHAEEQRHVAVQIVAAVLEAVVHTRTGAPDAVELAQRAMAAARTHQLGPEMQRMPQARILLDCLDLACCLIQFSPDQAAGKMQQMQNNLDTITREEGWRKDGTMLVELGQPHNDELEKDTAGIMKRSSDGNAALILQWITQPQVYAIGFILSGLASVYKNAADGKCEKFLKEGFKVTNLPLEKISRSLAAANDDVQRQASMNVAMRLLLVSAYCARYEWRTARKAIQELRKEYSQRGSETDQSTVRVLLYQDALCRQGLGDLQGALKLYGSPNLAFDPASKASVAEKDLRALATLNSTFIMRSFGVEEASKADTMLSTIEPYCRQHTNKSMKAVFYVIRGTAQDPNNAIIKTKAYLQSAVQASQAASNSQLLVLVMNMMTTTFFTNIVGDQAAKSARAGRSLAKKSRDRLWTLVADGMYGEIMERCGNSEEAAGARREARSLLNDLPESLRSSMSIQETNDVDGNLYV